MSAAQPRLFLAETKAQSLLDEYSIHRPSEIILEDLAYALGIEVTYRPLSGADAHLVRVGDKGGITINAALDDVGRRRFALAHELGHWVLHKGRTQVFMCTAENMHDYDSSVEEIEANAFASSLLLPMKMMLPQHRTAEPSLALIESLAERFNVSMTAAALRYVSKFGHPVIVVFSSAGTVDWWRRNEETMEYVYLEKAQKLQKGSCAADVAVTGISSGDMRPVDWGAWFPHLPRRSGDLYEQSIRFHNYGVVMSLLWLA
ncbi:MAG TPA: ImmA/IrrE family metallo-endopeptidase [Lacunisphaera sp.]